MKQAAKKYGFQATIVAILTAALPYFTSVVNAKHEESMARIRQDSARQSEYQIWNNNKIDEQECRDSVILAEMKKQHKCNP